MACGGARSRSIFAERGMSVLAGRPDARLLMRGSALRALVLSDAFPRRRLVKHA